MSQNGAVRRHRFADGSAVRLELSDGDWVLVRQELSYGQQRRLAAAGLTGLDNATSGADHLRVDFAAYDLERLAVWVLDWSFRDADGDHVTVSRAAIESLHPDTAAEINRALDAHIEAQEAKKAPSGPAGARRPSGSAATSPSAAPSGGAGRS